MKAQEKETIRNFCLEAAIAEITKADGEEDKKEQYKAVVAAMKFLDAFLTHLEVS